MCFLGREFAVVVVVLNFFVRKVILRSEIG